MAGYAKYAKYEYSITCVKYCQFVIELRQKKQQAIKQSSIVSWFHFIAYEVCEFSNH
jgi:hypothetical protein